MKFISFFAGIGGIDLGLERAGHECVGQVEIDPFCIKVLEKHWPNVPRWGDIKELNPDELPTADLWAGGFPCKQTSVAAAITGHRTGLTGKDSGLWHEYFLRIRHRMPRWVLVENPPGVKAWEAEIAGRLAAIGYTVSRLELSAAGVAAPHLRRRVFYAANIDGQGLEVAGTPGSPPIECEPWRTPARNFWREAEPGVLRMDHGLPSRMDRIRACGNAVVPQVAEYIGRLLSRMEGE